MYDDRMRTCISFYRTEHPVERIIGRHKRRIESKRNNKADPVTYQTAEPDIFVGGEFDTGPKFAIDAIAAGKEGCVSIHRFVHEGHSLTLGRVYEIFGIRQDNWILKNLTMRKTADSG